MTMVLSDYGAGKPLTARRILEVNNAIEALLNWVYREVIG